jgi:hypothetical protein
MTAVSVRAILVKLIAQMFEEVSRSYVIESR